MNFSSLLRRAHSRSFASILFGFTLGLHWQIATAASATSAPVPLTVDSLRLLVSEGKVTPDQAKILQADLDYLTGTQAKIVEFRRLPAEQAKLKSNVLKYQTLQRELSVAEHKLAADQLKLTAVAPTPTPTPKPRH